MCHHRTGAEGSDVKIWEVRYQDPDEPHRNYSVGYWVDRDDAETVFRRVCREDRQNPDEPLVLGWDCGFVLDAIDVMPSSKQPSSAKNGVSRDANDLPMDLELGGNTRDLARPFRPLGVRQDDRGGGRRG